MKSLIRSAFQHTGRFAIGIAGAWLGLSSPAMAIDDASLQKIVEQRLLGDRTGACWAVAVITDTVAKAIVCADPARPRNITATTAFEIGSVTKTMNAILLYQLAEQKKLRPDDPIELHLPAGVTVPSFAGKKIRLKHLIDHSAGLPALPTRFAPANNSDPYADLTQEVLLGSLADVTLSAAPGTHSAYSNWGAMILSFIIARVSNTDYETLIRERLFAPLGMTHSFIRKSRTVQLAQGHLSTSKPTVPWDFPVNMAGVGGVRASLDDMIAYTRAQMKQASKAEQHGWNKAPSRHKAGAVWFHEGGTGGFSSLVMFDQPGHRGVVILSDTSMVNLGGLGGLGIHLMDPGYPLEKPRKELPLPSELLKSLVGEYQFGAEVNNMRLTLSQRDSKLIANVSGQAPQALRYDSAGDLFFEDVDAVIRPNKRSDGSYSLQLLQGGAVAVARRADAAASTILSLTPGQLQAYVGRYRISANFALDIAVSAGQLTGQATGQGVFLLEPIRKDVFAAEQFGIEIVFKRDTHGKVLSLDLYQGGRTTSAQREP